MRLLTCLIASLLLFALLPVTTQAQQAVPADHETTNVPALEALTETETSALRKIVTRYSEDRAALHRRYDISPSPTRESRLASFYSDWQDELTALSFNDLGVEGRIDYVLLDHELERERNHLERQRQRSEDIEPLIPFVRDITHLFEDWRDHPDIDSRSVSNELDRLAERISSHQEVLRDQHDAGELADTEIDAYRAANTLSHLQEKLNEWFTFYDTYDPDYSWWVTAPYEAVQEELSALETFLREEIVGVEGDQPPIVGDPIGRAALEADLRAEIIPYSPDELIEIGEEELAWGEAQMQEAAQEMGFDDWRDALEEVKMRHVAPGEQPNLVKELSDESVAFITERNLLTVPSLADEVWRMRMLSPEQQQFAPFFLGGEVVRIAYPSSEMSHDLKHMSIRGNNRHFTRAIVHHELIPGHHLQGFMTSRYNAHRSAFRTPFWGEGWALYWEMQLWEHGFAESPEDRIGMLFWRNHRAARIIFSLRFHLGEMSAQEAIDFLVERVGHERANAEAEVRRSLSGDYPPLYQAAYMLGGLQFMALHKELVENGDWTDREFHDAILQGGRKPVEMVRARLLDLSLDPEYETQWYFYETLSEEDE